MKRSVYLAVEATGLDANVDRLVEIVALEAIDSRLTGKQFQVLLNPHHLIKRDAEMVIGYNNLQLERLPEFSQVVQDFLEFLSGADLIAFNANWAFALMENELTRLNFPPLSQYARRLKNVKSLTEKLITNVRLSLDRLSVLFDAHEPVQACSQTWRDCFLLAQVFPRLERIIVFESSPGTAMDFEK